MERRMTHNEYSDYCKEKMVRLWNKTGYSFKDFEQDVNSVQIIPYDLTEYPKLTEKSIKYINALFGTEETDKKGQRMFKGFTRAERISQERELLGIRPIGGCYYSGYGVNKEELMVYSWCEGDTYLKVFKTEKEFNDEVRECKVFYEYN